MQRPPEHKEVPAPGQANRVGFEGCIAHDWRLRSVRMAACGLALVVAGPSWSARPGEPLSLELRLSEARVGGYVTRPGVCHLEIGRRLVDARLEGSALVGTVLLCHTTALCGERSYPFLGLPRPDGKGWVAQLTPEEGCRSPVLDGSGRLLLDGSLTPPAGEPAHVSPPANAARKSKEALTRARSLLDRGDFANASLQFQRALSYEDARWDGYLGLGEAELRRGNLSRAAEALEDAATQARIAGIDSGEILFLQARVQARQGRPRQALESLRRALRVGLERGERIAKEQDLNGLHGLPEFAVLSARVGAKRPSTSPVRAEKRH